MNVKSIKLSYKPKPITNISGKYFLNGKKPEISIFPALLTKPQKSNNDSTSTKKFTIEDFAHVACIMSVLNGPEIIDDTMGAYNQIINKFQPEASYHNGYSNKIAQHPFSFFRGTILAPYLNPFSEKCPHPKIASWLNSLDLSLWDTKFGTWVKKKLKIREDEIETTISRIDSIPEIPSKVPAKIIITDSIIKDILARAMLRTSVLNVLALSGVEAIDTAQHVMKGENFLNTAKASAISLLTTITTTGILGAIGAKHYGPTGSLAGMTLGSITGKIVKTKLKEAYSNDVTNH